MSKALAGFAEAVDEARWKRANVRRVPLTPALKALVYEPFGQAA